MKPSEHEAGDEQPEGQIDVANMQAGADIAGLDQAVVHAEDEDEHDLGDEEQAEEECEAAQALIAAAFEGQVIDLVDEGAQHIEGGHQDDAGEDRVDAEPGVGDVSAI